MTPSQQVSSSTSSSRHLEGKEGISNYGTVTTGSAGAARVGPLFSLSAAMPWMQRLPPPLPALFLNPSPSTLEDMSSALWSAKPAQVMSGPWTQTRSRRVMPTAGCSRFFPSARTMSALMKRSMNAVFQKMPITDRFSLQSRALLRAWRRFRNDGASSGTGNHTPTPQPSRLA
jgi:hypothetical protein